MGFEMGTDADLLNDLVNEAPVIVDRRTGRGVALSRKQIAHWTGKSVQTISEYGAGSRNIPIDFWQRILLHVFDLRIVRLLVPEDVEIECHFPAVRPLQTGPDFFRECLQVEQAHHQMMMRIMDILADGRVDELDAESIERYRKSHLAHRLRDGTLFREIMHAFQESKQEACP